jgi:hypothetical protein
MLNKLNRLFIPSLRDAAVPFWVGGLGEFKLDARTSMQLERNLAKALSLYAFYYEHTTPDI